MAMAQQALDLQFQAVEFPSLASSASTGRSTVTSWATMAANVAHLPVPVKVAPAPPKLTPKLTPKPTVNNNDNIRWADDDDYDDDDYADIDHAIYLEQQAFDALPAQQTYLQYLLDGNDDGAW